MKTLKEPSEIRITDSYVKRAVERERKAAGEKSLTRTAGRLIIERLTQKESPVQSSAS